ncbi:hypothetical protein Tco_0635405 [Tanacetum coccineum]
MFYDDPFDFKEEKIKESKLLIDELDLPKSNNVLPFAEYDSIFYEDFFEVDALSSTNTRQGCPGFLKPLVLAVFVLRSQELHILSFILGIRYPNLID